ncbi:hypothetical protein [Myxacorys almedinensis]|uniref:Uncharacterized protein n=1 Tax=Myxacorys almedinensis A TaxID=2690445 RepID=A0A8J7Z264_9CYAN|nr:hypothetical protein [Myxacorys almedinensis]NDJ19002.1 hypothetical protein [Myxacorys almedinensis A]
MAILEVSLRELLLQLDDPTLASAIAAIPQPAMQRLIEGLKQVLNAVKNHLQEVEESEELRSLVDQIYTKLETL